MDHMSDPQQLNHRTAHSAPTGPSKGFFNTVLARPSTNGASASAQERQAAETSVAPKLVRDTKRRATHSQIERRRREKINDRLITLRSIVPACAQELQDRQQQRLYEEREAARIAAGGTPKTVIDAVTGKPKRKRNRRKLDTKKAQSMTGADEELGLHKLEVLTHAINHIFELKARIHYLETGIELHDIPTAENPFNLSSPQNTPFTFSSVDDKRSIAKLETTLGEADHREEEEEDGLDIDGDDDEYNLIERHLKKRNSSAASTTRGRAVKASHRQFPVQSSSSSQESEETSPVVYPTAGSIPLTETSIRDFSSPLMSLSAESPIFLTEAADVSKRRDSQSFAFPTLPASAIPLPTPRQQQQYPPSLSERRESNSSLFRQLSLTSPNFGPYSPLTYCPAASARSRAGTLSFPSYGTDSEVRYTSGSGADSVKHTLAADREGLTHSAEAVDASAAAALLLNFSTSPEVLRPVGSTKVNSTSGEGRPIIGLSQRQASRSVFTSPQYRPQGGPGYSGTTAEQNYFPAALRTPASAPGGSTASRGQEYVESLDLGSPSHLALDASPEEITAMPQNQHHDQTEDDVDTMSDVTLEDIPVIA